MKMLRTIGMVVGLAMAGPAWATQGAVNLASPTGSVQTTSDATSTNLIPMTAICGATSSATLYATCANQVFVNASGQLGVTGPVTQSGTWNITNVSGAVSLPTGAATSALQPTNAAQGSTTSGQTGGLVQGAVTTSGPSYTTGQTSPFSLDTSGNLRVNVVTGGGSGGTSSTYGSAFPGTGTAAGAEYLASAPTLSNGNMVALQTDVNGNLKVNVASGGGSGGTSSSFGSAFPGTGTAIGLTNGTNMVAWSATSNYGTAPAAIAVPAVNANVTNLPADTSISPSGTISAADVGSTVTVNQQNGQTLITGSPTANSTLSFSGVSGFQTGTLQCTASGGAWVQTDQVQVSTDGAVWTFAKWASFGNEPAGMPPFTLPFTGWNINLTGVHFVRIAAQAWTSGSPTCTLLVTANLLTSSNATAFLRGSANTTGTGATTIIAAQGANSKILIKGAQCKNSGATSTIVTLNDTVSTVLIVPAAGGDNEVFDPPLILAANTALTFTPGAGSTTIYCNAQGYTGS